MEWSLQIAFLTEHFFEDCLGYLESISLPDIDPTCTVTKTKQNREKSQILLYIPVWGGGGAGEVN